MAALTNTDILAKVKNGLGITGDYQDDTLTVYIEDVQAFMLDAGVEESVINDSAAIGCILRGVADLWDYGNGTARLSEYFKMRVMQLATGGASNV